MKKVVVFLVGVCFSMPLFSQTTTSLPSGRLGLGFLFGLNYSNLLHDKPLPANASITNGIGGRLGLMSESRVFKSLFFSPKLELSFNNGKVNFQNPDGSETVYNCQAVSLEVMTPFLLKLEKEKLSPYFFAGPNVKIPLNDKANDALVYKNTFDFAINFGIGLEKSFTAFNFSPELRYSYGLLNVNKNPQLRGLYSHSISLVLKFFG